MIDLTIRRSSCNPGQWRFLQSTASSVLLAGGFGSGKTLGLGLKLLQLKAVNPGVPGLFMAQTWRAMWSTTYRRLMSFLRLTLPREALPRIRDRQGECYLDFGDGVPVYLRSAHDVASFDGLDVGFALMDEARHVTALANEVFMGRVRIRCPLPQKAYTSTPATNWLADEFNSGLPGHELIRAPTRENRKHLAPDYEANLRLSYSRRMQQAVLDGLFVNLTGSVYEAFSPLVEGNPWIVDYEWRANRGRKTILAVDPGFRRSAWLLIHELTPTSWIVFHQLMLDDTSDDAAVQRVNDLGVPIDEIWCDPAADQTQSTLNLDTLQMLKGVKTRAEGAVRYISGPFRSVEYGVDKVRTLLGDPEASLPVRIFFARCLIQSERGARQRGILKDLAAYRYPEEKDLHAVKDQPLKDGVHDHACDALRMFGVGMWLTSPLRELDPKLKEHQQAGYKRAA